ncbi:MAG TPA: tetratricopeptide repeat protein [Tepidisphaeraceae bacterium]|jgi:predicted O-linked N-acetylglucosamine transferase (SPINDLY family)|nr:tetratricopeptide repeat protein [Tepidisphaeraceae bacterium]
MKAPIQQSLEEGLARHDAGQLDQAEEIYRRILASEPNQAGVLNNLANVLKDSGRIEEAVDCCRAAIAMEPQNAEIHSSLCYKLHFHPGYDRASIFRELCEWDRRHGGGNVSVEHDMDRSPDRRLRIGYVSPDFYGHAECFFVLPLLEAHDRHSFEVHCYASVRRPDKATELLKSCAPVWHDVLGLSNDQLAKKIREDRIDILVDLTMHMAFNRLPMFAQRPAPVQVTWLAYPGGTGMKTIDYRLTDVWMDPPGDTDPYYAERSVRLPDCWCCYHPLGEVPPAAPREKGAVMFGSLNNPCKLNDSTLRLWSAVLANVRDSRLLLLVESDRQRARIREMMKQTGTDPGRIEFTGRHRRGEYLRVYDRLDICLDPLPYNGITTTCDALWMGVPVVSRIGPTAAGRAGLSILSNLQMPEFVAADDPHFIAIAAGLAEDFGKRSELRKSLRSRIRASPVMDGKRFARNVEAAFRKMWRRWCGV